eukprot:m.231683 g.231683  ORF g.231683 m.231683 type:complete len:72 (-) comp54278_c5_seq3:120-335(-)
MLQRHVRLLHDFMLRGLEWSSLFTNSQQAAEFQALEGFACIRNCKNIAGMASGESQPVPSIANLVVFVRDG